MHSATVSGLIACLALSACSSYSRPSESNDARIEQLSDSERKSIDAARAEEARRGDEWAAARQDILRAKAEWKVAKADLDLAEAKVDKAKAEVAVAETGTASELEKAREALHDAQASLTPQRELIHWREAEITRCEKAETVAERRHDVAGARVELEKARAFAKTEQADSRQVDVPEHEAHVRECEKRESLAKVELEAAERECKVAQRTYDDAKGAAKK